MEKTTKIENRRPFPDDVLDARDCLQLLILEYGDIHIEKLATLLHLTSSVEIEFSHICAQRQT